MTSFLFSSCNAEGKLALAIYERKDEAHLAGLGGDETESDGLVSLGEVTEGLESTTALIIILEEVHVDVEVAKENCEGPSGCQQIARLERKEATHPQQQARSLPRRRSDCGSYRYMERVSPGVDARRESRTDRHKWIATVMLAGLSFNAALISSAYCLGSCWTSSPRDSALARISSDCAVGTRVNKSAADNGAQTHAKVGEVGVVELDVGAL